VFLSYYLFIVEQMMFNVSTCSDNLELLKSGNFKITNFLASRIGVQFSEVTLFIFSYELARDELLGLLKVYE
jgi:hypothetical protein